MFLVVFQCGGMRVIPYQGYVLGLLILALTTLTALQNKFSLRTDKKPFIFMFVLLAVFVSHALARPDIVDENQIVFFMLSFINAIFYVQTYRSAQFEDDLCWVLKVYLYHSLINFALLCLIPSLFSPISSVRHDRVSLLFLFYGSSIQNGLFDVVSRNQGLFWEPGVLQFFLNTYLFLQIKNRKSLVNILIATVGIILADSTTGFALLAFNYLYYFYKNRNVVSVIVVIILIGSCVNIIISNVNDKIYGLQKDSSRARAADLHTALYLISESPLYGFGAYSIDYLSNSHSITIIKEEYFSELRVSSDETVSDRGISNGCLGLVVKFGIPISLIVFYFLYKQRLVMGNRIDKIAFFILIIVTTSMEPILFITYFFIYIVSGINR